MVATDTLEEAEAEVEVTVRVGVDARHTAAAVSDLPEPIFLIERGVPLAFGQVSAHLLVIKDQAGTLSTQIDAPMDSQKCHAFF